MGTDVSDAPEGAARSLTAANWFRQCGRSNSLRRIAGLSPLYQISAMQLTSAIKIGPKTFNIWFGFEPGFRQRSSGWSESD